MVVEREELIKEVQNLIGDAHTALQLSGTVALGKHFMDQHTESKKNHGLWLIGAGTFFACAIGLGIWILSGYDASLSVIAGRFSLIPLSLIGAYFCASQYNQQKRIIEDYAYKKVLALSMTSFRGELEKGEIPDQSKDYIKTVLGEIHRYPLDAIAPDKLPKEEQKIIQTIRESMLSYFKNL